MEIRRATQTDYSGICELARSHYKENPTPADRQQGFLSARFSLQQITDIANSLGIIIASDAGRVAGFMCASRCEWSDQPAIVRQMLDNLWRYRFHEQPLDKSKVFVYGPVCIDLAYRGRGVLRKMHQCLNRGMDGLYPAGVAFVANDNQASLRAHIDGLGMHQVGDFLYLAHTYQVLAFDIKPAAGPA